MISWSVECRHAVLHAIYDYIIHRYIYKSNINLQATEFKSCACYNQKGRTLRREDNDTV
jgi:hypothetical protein